MESSHSKKPSKSYSAGEKDQFENKVKPQIAKKLRKERRLQKLLQKLDKEAYQNSQKNINDSIELNSSPSKKRKKNQIYNESKDHAVDPNIPKSRKKLEKFKKAEIVESQDDDAEMNDEFVPGKNVGRPYTVSIAVAGSILDNAQTSPLKAYLAGQIARAAGIFNVDEVVVYDDTGGNASQACELMARILQYLESPPYLRKYLFQIHPDLQYAGLIAPLDIPHHLRRHEALPYREGVVSSKPTKDGKDVSYIYVGLDRECRVEKKLPEGIRVTVKFDNPTPGYVLKPKGKLKGSAISPTLPRSEAGIYWGYTVRIADSLSKVFSQCPFRDSEGYDLTLGTSEKGYPVEKFKMTSDSVKHILIVFGGVEGLEYALENDESSTEDDVSVLFDHYVNTCHNQGSRTIRTEEAILISMTALAPIISNSCK